MPVVSFWSVWRESSNQASTKRHDSFESALAEAERLSRKEHERFYVLKTIGYAEPAQRPIEYHQLID